MRQKLQKTAANIDARRWRRAPSGLSSSTVARLRSGRPFGALHDALQSHRRPTLREHRMSHYAIIDNLAAPTVQLLVAEDMVDSANVP